MSRVLITGANRGLGLEFARQYAADGWDVIATSRHPDNSSELQQLLRKNNKVSLNALDVTSDKSVETLAHTLRPGDRFARPKFSHLYANWKHDRRD